MNKSGYVAEATRIKVLEAVRELGYQPNLLARSLINQKSSFVYVIVPDVANPFYAELTKGVEMIAIREKYDIILSSAHRNELLEAKHLEAAKGRMADGVILVLPSMEEKKLAHYARQIPLVVVDRDVETDGVDTVFIDQLAGAQSAVKHLLDLGHRKIAYIAGDPSIQNNGLRHEGYCRSLESSNLKPEHEYFFQGDFTFESGCRAFTGYMAIPNERRPTALFAASDLMALGFMHNAYDHGVQIPRDISVVGFDDISMASIYSPSLTTVRHPYIAMGQVAMQHLLKKIAPNRTFEEAADLKNSLIIRNSTAPCTEKTGR
jgi:DNA-binding LacI/PurR family transcriptional regulator